MSEEELQVLTREIEASNFHPSDIMQIFSPSMIKTMYKMLGTSRAFTLTQFVKTVLKLIPTRLQGRSRLAYGLFKLFQEICKIKNQERFLWEDFTDFIANRSPKLAENIKIQEKVLPFGLEIDRHIKHKIKPPEVIGTSRYELRRLRPILASSDRMHHINRRIEKACYSAHNELFFCMDSPSRHIEVLDRNYNRKFRVTTTQEVSEKDALVISMHWAESEGRLGCIFSNHSTSFWSLTEDFRVELTCALNFLYVKSPPNRIFYVQSESVWIKLDSKPIVYILDQKTFQIKDSFQHTRMRREDDTVILLGEILYHKLLVVGFEKSVFLILLSRKQVVTSIEAFETNIYTLCFSDKYQTLVVGCFQSYLHCFQLSEFCDLTEKGRLTGNMELSTAVCAIPDSSIVASFQSNSVVKLWNLADCSCFQFFSTYKNIEVREIIPVREGIVLVGSKLLEFKFETQKFLTNKASILQISVNRNLIGVITSSSIYYYNAETGWPAKILRHPMEESSIVLGKFILLHDYVVLVSEESLLVVVDTTDGNIASQLSFKQRRPIALHYDELVNIVTFGTDQEIYLIEFFKHEELQVKRTLRLVESPPLSILTASSSHDMVAFGLQRSNLLELYSFERLHHRKTIKLSDNPEEVRLVPGKKLILILLKREVLSIRYQADSQYKSIVVFELCHRVTTEQNNVDSMWLVGQTVYLCCPVGILAEMDASTLNTEDIGVSVTDTNSYNAYRKCHQDYIYGSKESLNIDEDEVGVDIIASTKIYNHNVSAMTKMGDLLLTAFQNGYVKLYGRDWDIKGSVDTKESFPQVWKGTSNHETIKCEVRLVLNILEYLRINEPAFQEYFVASSSPYNSARQKQEKLIVKKTHLAKQTPSGLKEIKLILDKQKQQAKTNERYLNMLARSKPEKNKKSKRAIEQTKEILQFFNKDFAIRPVALLTNTPELPESVRNLESRLNNIMEGYLSETRKVQENKTKKKSIMAQTRRSSVQVGKRNRVQSEYFRTEIAHANNQALNNVRKSLSLPKLRYREGRNPMPV